MKKPRFLPVPRLDRLGMILLTVAFLALLFTICYLGKNGVFGNNSSTDSVHWQSQRSPAYANLRGNARGYNDVGRTRAVHLQPFDPNTADAATLLSLGLRPWQVKAIYHYRAAGGVYSRKEDFARLYGLTLKQYRQLEPYIRIAADYQPAANFVSSPAGHEQHDTTMPRQTKMRTGDVVQLNHADSAELLSVPGIGSYFASAIVRYRNALGGFVSAGQLSEIQNFPARALPYIKVQPEVFRKIDINKLTLQQLKRHPYINFYQARDIVERRRTRGAFKSASELRMLHSFTDADIERLTPYLSFEEN